MNGLCVRRGFTLIELLVVIAIITLLVAIGIPVMGRARETARRSQCMGNLHNIAMALRLYRVEEGGYPGPYDPVVGVGGLNALYPRYLESRKSLLCPNDPVEDVDGYKEALRIPGSAEDDLTANLLDRAGQMYAGGCDWRDATFFSEHYSSYNQLYNWIGYIWWQPDPNKPQAERYISQIRLLPGVSTVTYRVGWADNIAYWYEWFRWDPEGLIGLGNFPWVDRYLAYFLAQQVYWDGYEATSFDVNDARRLKDALQRPLWDWADYQLDPYGLPSSVFPGLVNRNAPENTIVTRCPHHRRSTKNADIVLRLDGSTEIIAGPPDLEYNWAVQPTRTR